MHLVCMMGWTEFSLILLNHFNLKKEMHLKVPLRSPLKCLFTFPLKTY
jgi:hypothetical protein